MLKLTAKRYLMYISQNYSYAILRPLQEIIRQHYGEVAWFLEGKEVNAEFLKQDEQRLLTVEAVKAWQPEVVFAPANIIPTFIPGLKVAVFHGFDAGKLNRKGQNDHFKIRNCFDLYCTQGPNTTTPFQKLAEKYGHFKVAETGWSMLDGLFLPIENNPYKSSTETRKTVLMCSTFSRKLSCAPILFEEIKRLSQTGKWRWLIQFHPKMPQEIIEQYKELQSEHLSFIETDNVIPLLQAADVMLCDTSSILQMFILQRRPVVTFRNQAPDSHLLNITEIADLEQTIEHALSKPIDLLQAIEAYCQQLHPYQDGQSSLRVLQTVNNMLVNHQLSELKPKPLNLIRNLKMRKKLGYWKI